MFRTILMTAAAVSALAAGPALSGPGGGNGGGQGGGGGNGAGAGAGAGGFGGPAGAALDARLNSMGPSNASPTGIDNANPNSVLDGSGSGAVNGRAHSKGAVHASPTGLANASENSVLAGTTAASRVDSGPLQGLATGMTLMSNGAAVGTVQQIRMTGNGLVAIVVVQGANGRLYPIPASKLVLSGGALTTTARLNGINGGDTRLATAGQGRVNSQGPLHASATGIAHASSNSVLNVGPVTMGALAGLASGATVQFNGNAVGTVQRVITSSDGTVRRVLVTDTNGRTVSLSPDTLSYSGGVLTTTSFRGG